MKLAATNASSPQSGKFRAKVTTRNTTPSPTNAHVAWRALSILLQGESSSPGSRSGGKSRIGRTISLTSRQTTRTERFTSPNSWRGNGIGTARLQEWPSAGHIGRIENAIVNCPWATDKSRDSDATLSIASTHYLIRDELPRMKGGGGLEMFPPAPFTGLRWLRPFW